MTLVYQNKFTDSILLLEQNPCGCCPEDWLVEFSKKKRFTWTGTQVEVNVYLKHRGYLFLGEV